MIGILDFGLGNIASISNMYKRMGINNIICRHDNDLNKSNKFILPGVGSFDNAMQKVKKSSFFPILEHKVLKEKNPILGICLGMQILFKKSEEGQLPGLGWVDGEVKKIKSSNLILPHMGWNNVKIKNKVKLITNLTKNTKFYFIHSYVVKLKNKKYEILETHYGEDFTSSFAFKNFYGVQFHPEKSHKHGMKILKNFCEI